MTGSELEQEVRALARALWGLPAGGGGPELIDGHEIDCVCRTEELVHLVECTIERKLDKVTKDVNKLTVAKRSEERRGNTVKLWIVTEGEPTPQQRTAARNNGVTIISLDQFQARLLDASSYLKARWSYRFGSASDPATGSLTLSEEEYVPISITDVLTGEEHSVSSIADLLLRGRTVVLLGPFGAGKSITVREVFRELRKRFFKAGKIAVPVAINLREHWGQTVTDEVLRRHASKIGFEHPDQLVRAWNGGRLVALLDGFDELASQVWRVGPSAMRRTRKEALGLVRSFIRETAGRSGVLVSGRDQYFDAKEEMYQALALPADAIRLMLGEFTEEQARDYLAKKGITADLPVWLPRKALLLGYLTARNLLQDVLAIGGEGGPAYAWDEFLDKVCTREAQLTDDVDGSAVRRILELLALKTRETVSGTGPLYERDLSGAYIKVTGVEPLEAARVLLQRLPGLTSREQEEGARSFVDADMLEALRGSAVARFVQNPYSPIAENRWNHGLPPLGCQLAALVVEKLSLPITKHRVAAAEALARWHEPTLAIDCVMSGAMREDDAGVDCEGLVIEEGLVDTIDLESLNLNNLHLKSCHINELNIGGTRSLNLRISQCLVNRVVGAAEPRGLPVWMSECEVGEFDNVQTTEAILNLPVPTPVRVMLTILRKIFVQKGRGRKESSLYRGLDQHISLLVPRALEILQAEAVIYPIRGAGRDTIWYGRRTMRSRSLGILAAAGSGTDAILVRARELS